MLLTVLICRYVLHIHLILADYYSPGNKKNPNDGDLCFYNVVKLHC